MITHYPSVVAISEYANGVTFAGPTTDAFGRLRTSSPLTFFDSQHRYKDNGYFDTSLSGGGSTAYLTNESSVSMSVGTTSGDSVIRQTKRCFPYQSGKSLLTFNSFVFAAGKTNLRQRVGSFNTNNGVFFELNGTTKNFVVRNYASGSVVENRVAQSNWNTDKFDGTGPSGITLDLTKTHILYTDVEWLGVGTVRMGFVIDGVLHVCHRFNHANNVSTVYMTTASLPIRLEITNTGTTASSSTMKQICSSVMSEGGYERKVAQSVARRTTDASITVGSIVPIVSIRLASNRLDSVVLPSKYAAFPTSTGDFEVMMIRNGTLTGASYDTTTFSNVDFDVTATAITGGTILSSVYASATNQSGNAASNNTEYNWDLQLGSTIAGVSDVITLAARTFSGTNTIIGTMDFYDLT